MRCALYGHVPFAGKQVGAFGGALSQACRKGELLYSSRLRWLARGRRRRFVGLPDLFGSLPFIAFAGDRDGRTALSSLPVAGLLAPPFVSGVAAAKTSFAALHVRAPLSLLPAPRRAHA